MRLGWRNGFGSNGIHLGFGADESRQEVIAGWDSDEDLREPEACGMMET